MQRAEKKAKYFHLEGLCWSREAKQAARENPGKVFVVFLLVQQNLEGWGSWAVLRAEQHIPALLSPLSREITYQKQRRDGGMGSLLWAAPAAPPGLDFSLCLALQEGLQPLGSGKASENEITAPKRVPSRKSNPQGAKNSLSTSAAATEERGAPRNPHWSRR